jgi:hypothetical protein
MDEKWCQHDIMVVIIRELHGSWIGVVVTKLQLQLSCNWVVIAMYTKSYKTNCQTPIFFIKYLFLLTYAYLSTYLYLSTYFYIPTYEPND